jgi:3-isopropylmalate dehydrogenase
MKLVAAPRHFDVILADNMFGDILSDEAAMLTGSLGHAARARASGRTGPGCSSPCTARRPTSPAAGVANPLAMILSAALMLRHGLGLEDEAAALESAVDRALAADCAPRTWAGSATTAEATEAVLKELRA